MNLIQMTLTQAIEENAKQFDIEGYAVSVDRAHGWVDINNGQDSVFLENSQGYDFIDEATRDYEASGEVTLEHAYKSLALSFVPHE